MYAIASNQKSAVILWFQTLGPLTWLDGQTAQGKLPNTSSLQGVSKPHHSFIFGAGGNLHGGGTHPFQVGRANSKWEGLISIGKSLFEVGRNNFNWEELSMSRSKRRHMSKLDETGAPKVHKTGKC